MKMLESLSKETLLIRPERLWVDAAGQTDMAVVVQHGRFVDLGPADEVTARHLELEPVHLPGRLLMPGFVDTHHHLTQSFGKSLAFGEPSEIFRRIWVPLEQHLDAHDLYLAAKLAALEALRGGFTTVCDAGTRSRFGMDAVRDAVREAGIRCVLARICHDVGVADADLAQIEVEARSHLTADNVGGLIHPSLAVAIPEAATATLLSRVAALCREARVVMQVHVNEHLASIERSLIACGRRPLEVLADAGALGPQLLAAHATMLTPHELRKLADSGAAVSYNPVASSWKGNAVAPALQMACMGIRLGLGTDGTRSDGFRLMDAAETAQRLVFGLPIGDFSMGAGWTWVDSATRVGAAAAGLASHTGQIAVGLAADFLIVDLDVPSMTPSWDLGWELVRLAERSQIEAVFVQGRLRLWQGWPVDWDGRALLQEVRERASRAVAAAPIHRIHPTSDEARRAGS